MTYEERREVVSNEYVEPEPTVVSRETVVQQPTSRRVVEEPVPTYVQSRDPVGSSIAASSLIQTVVWAVVVIVILVVGILVLVHYNII